ncbi:DMT family transporter [Labrys okinawensis]|uniref:DMT family transporter n=1 Tax=Labrys okinawensis TaxID=346911 RepID=UPI0039BC7A48
MSSIEFQDDPWGRRWCQAPLRRGGSPGGKTGRLRVSRGTLAGVVSMVMAALLFALGASAARFASQGLDAFALVFWTNLCCFLFMALWVAMRRPAGGLVTQRIGLHLLRSVFTYAALLTYFYAIARIPFANAVVLQSLGPVFVPVLVLFALRRLAERRVWLGVLIGFAGVALIVRPAGLSLSFGEIAAVLAALGGAAATLVIWSLSTSEPAQRQMFYFSLFALLLSAFPLPWSWQAPGVDQILPIALTAAFTIAGQYFYARAFALAPGEKVNSWSYMAIVFAALIGFFAWGEPILPLTVLGAALVVVGAHLATRERALRLLI